MFFNLFGKKEDKSVNGTFFDRVYISTSGKTNACVTLAKEQPDTLFIAWFPETEKHFKNAFATSGLDETRVIEAKHLHTAVLQKKTPIFVEHFPLHQKEVDLISNWGKENILVFSALDEAIFEYFGSGKLLPLMKMLGMKEEEAIEHEMVSKSIANGQRKIAEKVLIEQSANSPKSWMEKNMGQPNQ